MSKTTIQTYVCTAYKCRHIEERAGNYTYTQRCPQCGSSMKHVGTRTVER